MPLESLLVNVPIRKSMLPTSAVVLDRRDIEALEFDAASAIEDRARIVDAAGVTPPVFADEYPKFEWSFSPFVRTSSFDPDEPLRVDYGLRVSGTWLR